MDIFRTCTLGEFPVAEYCGCILHVFILFFLLCYDVGECIPAGILRMLEETAAQTGGGADAYTEALFNMVTLERE